MSSQIQESKIEFTLAHVQGGAMVFYQEMIAGIMPKVTAIRYEARKFDSFEDAALHQELYGAALRNFTPTQVPS